MWLDRLDIVFPIGLTGSVILAETVPVSNVPG